VDPFRIDVAQGDLDELARRLDARRLPDELPGVGWEYGVAAGYLDALAGYWRRGYDWRAQERRLNQLPQFTTEIDGQTVHFAHLRSSEPDALALLLVHGWPSTFADFLDIVGPLSDPQAHGEPDARPFHVVVPSLPGFGFSGPTRERGWGIERIAHAFAELMGRLGYERYLAQGGDFGSLIAPELGRIAPEHVAGVHVNALPSLATIDWQSPDPLAGLGEQEIDKVSAANASWQQRAGYATVQSTRPQTLAYALTDSPLGLLAWNLEWFVDYDPTASEQAPIDRDAILTNVTIFWLTATAGSSARLYKEAGDAFSGGEPSGVPTAVAVFPGDAAIRTLAERSHHVVRWTEYDRGGHFASLQAPDLLVEDIRAFGRELR
jgi:pimeloyl-ACP methyl ester carboxylesterase